MYVLGACTCHVVHVQVSGKLSEIASPLPAVSKDLIQVFRIAGQASLPFRVEPACKLAFTWMLGIKLRQVYLLSCLATQQLVSKRDLGIQRRSSCFHCKDFTPPPLVLSSLENFSFDTIH